MNLAEITHPDPGVQRVCRRYAARVMSDQRVRRGDGNLKEQVQHYLEFVERSRVLAGKVREVLDSQEVPKAFSLLYCNFAKRVRKVMDRFALRSRHLQILEAMDRFRMYGLDEQTLQRICRDVLGYDIEEMGRELGIGA